MVVERSADIFKCIDFKESDKNDFENSDKSVKENHEADGKSYVYVLGENDIREVKWIETGLYGDSMVEVVGGLTEGENIILK